MQRSRNTQRGNYKTGGSKMMRAEHRKGSEKPTAANRDDDREDAYYNNGNDADFLSDEHTIADSFSMDSNDWSEEDKPDELADLDALEDYLHQRHTDAKEASVAAASRRYQSLQDALQLAADYGTEKRSLTRERRLRRLFHALTQYATGPAGGNAVAQAVETIRTAALYGLLRTTVPAEQYAACRVLEATSVVLPTDQGGDDWIESIEGPLKRVVETVQRATPVRTAALRALSTAVLVHAVDDSTTEALMDFCEACGAPTYRNEPTPDALRATAWDCWSLLATTVLDFDLAGQSDVQTGRGLAVLEALFRDALDSDTGNSDLLAAAGQCLALIHEARLGLSETHAEAADDDENGDGNPEAEEASSPAAHISNVTDRQFQRGSWEGSQWEDIMDEIRQRMAELSTESGYHMSKKAKKAQRATFREYSATICDDELPQEVIHFRNGSLELNSWREIIQLNSIRQSLQGGFQIQLMTNETLQAMFGADGRTLSAVQTGLSSLEKRLTLSKTSEAAKNEDVKRTKDRRKRDNIKNDFLLNDNE